VSAIRLIRRLGNEIAVAFQFLTRLPMPWIAFEADSLSRATKFFPLVGLAVGCGAVLLQKALMFHLPRTLVAVMVLTYFVLITGCLHEDGLADIRIADYQRELAARDVPGPQPPDGTCLDI